MARGLYTPRADVRTAKSVSSREPVRGCLETSSHSQDVVRQACEELSGTAAALREMRVHEQFRAKVASKRRADSAFGVREEAAEYRALPCRLHAYATVDDYRNDQLSGQVW
jgi:hypothetical protein